MQINLGPIGTAYKMEGAMYRLPRYLTIFVLLLVGGCAYPHGAILPQAEMSLPTGGCDQPVCGRQSYTVHPTVNSVQMSFTNGLPVPVHVTFQAPYEYTRLGVLQPSETIPFIYIRPFIYRGNAVNVSFVVQALDKDGTPIAVDVISVRINRNEQEFAAGIRRMSLPRGLR